MTDIAKAAQESSDLALWQAYCEKKMALEEAADEIERLRAALRNLLGTVDACKTMEVGAGGMTIEAQVRRSVYLRVPMWPFEEARAALEENSHD